MLARQALESPCGKPRRGAVNIFTVLQQRAQQVRADKPACAENQDRTLELANIAGTGPRCTRVGSAEAHCTETAADDGGRHPDRIPHGGTFAIHINPRHIPTHVCG